MIEFEEIKKNLKNKSLEDRTEMAWDGLLFEFSEIIHDIRGNIEDKGGLLMLVCDCAKSLINQNYEYIPLIVEEENGLIDNLFQLYEVIPPEMVTGEFTYVLISIIYALKYE